MSASLVGSEMCIRDSACIAALRAHAQALDVRRRATDVSTAALFWWGSHTVSYTHLTLPTICSV
eukprot:11911265-Alexandrium_andersonii.AAC.1